MNIHYIRNKLEQLDMAMDIAGSMGDWYRMKEVSEDFKEFLKDIKEECDKEDEYYVSLQESEEYYGNPEILAYEELSEEDMMEEYGDIS